MSEKPRRIKGLIFDKDGTLFDFAATWESWAKAFLIRLCDGDRGRAARMGAVIGFDFDAGRFARDSLVVAGTPLEIGAALQPYFPDLSPEKLVALINEEAAQAPQVAAVPLRPLLTDLVNKGLRLGVATNDAEAPARAHLEQAGVTGFFDFIAGCDSGHGGKPAPGQLLAFAAATGLAPAEIAMIGDSTHDLHAARAAGTVAIGVLTGPAEAATLRPLADVVLADIGALPGWLATAVD